MSWFKRSYDQQLKILYLPIAAAIGTVFILLSDISNLSRILLLIIIAMLVAIHWDMRDGGLLSKIIYKRGGTFTLRNYITVTIAYTLVTAILVLTGAYRTPMLMLYLIPIVLASIRGGHRMSLTYGAVLVIGYGLFFFAEGKITGNFFKDSYTYLVLFAVLSTATGLIADRLRRAAVDLSALYETGKALNSLLNAEEIMTLVQNIIQVDIRPDAAAVFLLDEEANKLRIASHRGLTGDVGDWVVDVGRGLIGKAAEGGSSILVSSAGRRWRLEQMPNMESMAAVPIRLAEQNMGVLIVGKGRNHAFNFENIRFLESLAGQTAISLQNARLYRQTKESASCDAMTGAYNYRYFTEFLDTEWNRAVRYEKPLSLIMIDVDLFKNVNDTHGHICGDRVLRELAEHLKRNTREIDVVARYGGEEFVVVLPETHYDDAYVVAEKLRQSTAATLFKVKDVETPINITLSLGIANYPTTSFSKDDLIYQADQALYQAKMQRNTLASPLDVTCRVNAPTEITRADF